MQRIHEILHKKNDRQVLPSNTSRHVTGLAAILLLGVRQLRRAGKGVWADPHPVPPWEWRKG